MCAVNNYNEKLINIFNVHLLWPIYIRHILQYCVHKNCDEKKFLPANLHNLIIQY